MSIQQKVVKLLIKKHITISVAESCTGGLIANKLTDVPGVSEVFDSGVVTYSERAKVKYLGVDETLLKDHGAVSREVAIAMAQGVSRSSETDIGISVTGIAGPSGTIENKPVGLVYIALYANGVTQCNKFNFEGNRRSIRSLAAFHALNMVLRFLNK